MDATRAPWVPPCPPRTRALAGKYRAGRLTLDELVVKLSGVEWGVCDWGSCQYAAALAMFRALGALRRAGAAAAFLPPPLPPPRPVARVADAMSDEVGDWVPPVVIMGLRDYRPPTLDAAFGAVRGASWDLWQAADVAFAAAFPVPVDFGALAGAGPAGAPSHNYVTGAKCFLLVEAGLVASEEAFVGFDS